MIFYVFIYVFLMIPRGRPSAAGAGRSAVAGKVAARSAGCAVAPGELARPKSQAGGRSPRASQGSKR